MALILASGSTNKAPISHIFEPFKFTSSPSLMPLLKTLKKNIPIPIIKSRRRGLREASVKLLDAFVQLAFEFVDEPLLPSQSNLAPVEEIGEEVEIVSIHGNIPDDFPQGVYIRNGKNPLFKASKSAVSIFGKTSSLWVEGEGMLHAVYFNKDSAGSWKTFYNNRYVETTSFLLEKERNTPIFLPTTEGNPTAVLLSLFLNMTRFGKPNKEYSNTNIIEHAGRFYSIAENHGPQEIDIRTLKTLGDWDVNGNWTRAFTSHPKRDPRTGELVIMGVDSSKKPYFELGVISADGTELVHKADLNFDRAVLSHEIGITQRYNVILDYPVIIDANRIFKGGPLIKYEKEKYSRIGVMPRYGNAESVTWFPVEAYCAFHIINCYEDGDDEVVVMACNALESIIPGPDLGLNKFEWFSEGLTHIEEEISNRTDQHGKLFARAYEWRLNMKTGEVKEAYLTGTKFAMDFPFINAHFTGLKNKYSYAQVVDSAASAAAGMVKYGGLAKLYHEEKSNGSCEIKVEYHMFPQNTYCSGAIFTPKLGAVEEDDGWIITFVHDEKTNMSQVYIVDAKDVSGDAVSIMALPNRVPYGFHGIFTSTGSQS